MLSKVTHLTLFVHDQNLTLEFYKKIGFSIHTDSQFGDNRWLTICLSRQKDFEIALLIPDNDEIDLVGRQAGNKPLFNIETTDCFKDYEHLMSNEIEVLEAPAQQPWGICMALKDLYGNIIYFCQPE